MQKTLTIISLAVLAGCSTPADTKPDPEPVEQPSTTPETTLPPEDDEPPSPSLKPLKFPAIGRCLDEQARDDWTQTKSRDYIVSIDMLTQVVKVSPEAYVHAEGLGKCISLAFQAGELPQREGMYSASLRRSQNAPTMPIPLVEGPADEKAVRLALVWSSQHFGRCVNNHLQAPFGGSLLLVMDIEAGAVKDAVVNASTFGNPPFDACIAEQAHNLTFENVDQAASRINYKVSMRTLR